MTITQLVLINVGALITAFGGVFLKKLSGEAVFNEISISNIGSFMLNPMLFAGAFCYVVPVFIWAYLLKSMELTKLQPMLSIVYIYTIGIAYLVLSEQPNITRLSGITLIIIGVIIVGRS
jgi:drug/metabolite transporter (DMT)-like permease